MSVKMTLPTASSIATGSPGWRCAMRSSPEIGDAVLHPVVAEGDVDPLEHVGGGALARVEAADGAGVLLGRVEVQLLAVADDHHDVEGVGGLHVAADRAVGQRQHEAPTAGLEGDLAIGDRQGRELVRGELHLAHDDRLVGHVPQRQAERRG